MTSRPHLFVNHLFVNQGGIVAQLTGGPPTPSVAAESALETRHLKSVAVASMVGTAIEFYDFFLYGLAASLVLNSQFFPKISPLLAGTLASLGTFGAGILARSGRSSSATSATGPVESTCSCSR
jgi:hypothetical protein